MSWETFIDVDTHDTSRHGCFNDEATGTGCRARWWHYRRSQRHRTRPAAGRRATSIPRWSRRAPAELALIPRRSRVQPAELALRPVDLDAAGASRAGAATGRDRRRPRWTPRAPAELTSIAAVDLVGAVVPRPTECAVDAAGVCREPATKIVSAVAAAELVAGGRDRRSGRAVSGNATVRQAWTRSVANAYGFPLYNKSLRRLSSPNGMLTHHELPVVGGRDECLGAHSDNVLARCIQGKDDQ